MSRMSRPDLAFARWRQAQSLEQRNILFLSLDTATQGLIGAGVGSFLAVFLVRLGASGVVVGLLENLFCFG